MEIDLGICLGSCFNAGKTERVSFDGSNNSAAIDVKMDGSVFEEQSSFNMLELSFSSKLDWDSYIVSIAKTASKQIGALVRRSMKFLSSEVALYFNKSTVRPSMEHYCHVRVDSPSCHLDVLYKLQRRTVGFSLGVSLEPLAHRRNVASLSLLVDVRLNWLKWFRF